MELTTRPGLDIVAPESKDNDTAVPQEKMDNEINKIIDYNKPRRVKIKRWIADGGINYENISESNEND